MGPEGLDVGHRGAAPSVDGLHGIADRRDRAAAEQGRQDHPLRDRGVLVLVEQDHPEGPAHRVDDLAARTDQVHAQAHVVLEPQAPGPLLGRTQVVDQPCELDALAGRPPDRLDPLGGPCHSGVDLRDRGAVVRPQLVRADRLLREVRVQAQHGLRHARRLPRDGDEPLGSAHLTMGQLRHGRPAEQPRPRLDAHPQALLVDQPPRERVIRRDRGLPDPNRVGGHDLAPSGQQGADPVGELGGSLVGERQSEHLVIGDQARRHEPQHAGRHDGGLARPCPGDDDEGLQGCAHAVPLLVGQPEAQQRVQVCAGHAGRRRHGAHEPPSEAGRTGVATPGPAGSGGAAPAGPDGHSTR